MSALTSIEHGARSLGLELNHSKSELICVDDSTKDCILSSFPLLKITDHTARGTLPFLHGRLTCL